MKAVSSTGINVYVSWSVCLSVTFAQYAQTAKDIDFSPYDSPVSLSDRSKIWLTSANPFLGLISMLKHDNRPTG